MTSQEIERTADAIRIERGYSLEKIRSIIFEQSGEDVSLITVKNFFSGKTENPNAHTIHIMLHAVGAKLEVSTEISDKAITMDTVEDFRSTIRTLGEDNERKQARIVELEKKNTELATNVAENTAKLAAAQESSRWGRKVITMLIAALVLLVLAILILCIIDMSRGDIGWFRALTSKVDGGLGAISGITTATVLGNMPVMAKI